MVDIKLEDLEMEEHPEPITTRWSRTALVLKPDWSTTATRAGENLRSKSCG
ncbi:hypothetical protein ACFQ0Q_39655 [Streptomyces aureus]